MVAGLEKTSSRDAQFQSFASVKRMDGESFRGIRLPPNAHCSPERRYKYVVQPQLTASDSSEYSTQRSEPQKEQRHVPFVAGILDIFTSLCLGGISGTAGSSSTLREKRREKKRNTKKSSTCKKKVVYPIASYPVRLNSKRLVDQRRRSLQRQNHQQHFFRPVPEDEFDRLKTRH
jgi:hypothetical protein